jgi:hypothetical protein
LAKLRSQPGYERSDAPPRLLAALAAGLALSIAIVIGGIAIAFPQVLSASPRGPLQSLPPSPRLQANPAGDMARYQQLEAHRLANYGWTADGHVRVPIDQAMNQVASQGWSSGK